MRFRLFCLLAAATMAWSQDAAYVAFGAHYNTAGPTSASNIIINDPARRIGWRFTASTTSPITHADASLTVSATPPATLWRLRIYAEATGLPDEAAPLSGESEEFSVSASGHTGIKAFSTPTGDLTPNTPYWLVMYKSSGADPDATRTVQARHAGARLAVGTVRLFNGTDWTTVAAVNNDPFILFRHADGKHRGYVGGNTSTQGSVAGVPNAVGANRNGLRVRFGSQVTLWGVRVYLLKWAGVANLQIVVYEGSTEKRVQTVPANHTSNFVYHTFFFSSPVTIAAGADCYIVFRQEGDGGAWDSSYNMVGTHYSGIALNYADAYLPPRVRAVSGSGNDPTTFTVHNQFNPAVWPLILDPETDLGVGASPPVPSGGKWISAR